MKLRTWIGCLGLAVLFSTGCVDISKSTIKTEENVIDRRPKVVPSQRFAANVKIEENILKVMVTAQCSIVEEETVERTEIADKTISGDDRAWMTALSVAGSLPAMGGTAMLADAPNVHDSNLNGRLYNETGQDVVIGVGVALVALGLAGVLPPMVNGLRAVGTDETTTTQTRNGALIQEQAPCAGIVTMPTYSVIARFSSGHTVPLGAAMPNDELHIDLRNALGPTILGMNPQPAKVAIWINEKFQAEIATDSILEAARSERDAQDDTTWIQAEAPACAKSAAACAKVQAYLQQFPNGHHAEEARKLLKPRTNVVAGDDKATRLSGAVDAAMKAQEETARKLDEDARKALEQSQTKIQKEAKKACEKECAKSCQNDATCRDACIVQVCP
ncbi:MAG: hypothetical protein HOW73_32755 [Polyangiaceae bacterium]|nr:hypothetical protein [Polyangiaceae bacterium]